MIIKRYLVNNMSEAVTKIRYELGKDAIIISHRKIKKPGFSGFFSKRVIEVTAAIDNSKNDMPAVNESINAIKKVMEKSMLRSEHKEDAAVIKKQEDLNVDREAGIEKDYKSKSQLNEIKQQNGEIIKQFQEMKNIVNSLAVSGKMNNNPNEESDLYYKLRNCDINSNIIKDIIKKVELNNEDIDENKKLEKALKSYINIEELKDSKIILLVGPTGVGKTTTIAKLAGKYALVDKKKVGLITIDTYRIGAVEQLKTYAEIMCVPIKVAMSANEIKEAAKSLESCDIILVDTTGRSSKNIEQISELSLYAKNINAKNISLVISATTKNNDIKSIVNGYKELNYNNVIITKLDETTTYGSIINIMEETHKPLSYVTTGQNVPDDIRILTQDELTSMILREDNK